jgi:hypothetical protein
VLAGLTSCSGPRAGRSGRSRGHRIHNIFYVFLLEPWVGRPGVEAEPEVIQVLGKFE